MLASARDLLVDCFGEPDKQLLRLQAVVDGKLRAIDELALHRHQADCNLGAANVDRDNNVAANYARFGVCLVS